MSSEVDPAKKIDDLIAGLDDWRSETLAQVRQLIHSALPDVEEQWKWGSPGMNVGPMTDSGRRMRWG